MDRKKSIIAGVGAVALIVVGVIGYQVYRSMQVSQGEALYNRGDYAAVVEYFAPILDGSSARADERVILGRALYRLRQYEDAQTVLQPLVQFGEEDIDAVALSGWVAIDQGNVLVAEERFEKVAVLGENSRANTGRAGALLKRSEGYKRQEIEQARFLISDALVEAPESVFVQLTAAELRVIEHDYDAAIEAAQQAVEIEPHWSKPHVLLGRAYLLAGQVEEAERAFQNGLERGGSQDEARYYLARSVYLQGRLSESRTLLNEIIESESSFLRVALEDAARIDVALGNLETAAQRLQQAFALQETPITGLQLYHVLVRLNKDIEAGQQLDTILAGRPFVSEARMERAHRFLREDEERRAINEYRTVRDNNPQNALASFNLGSLALGSDIARTAPDLLEMAATQYPDYLPATVNYALSLVDTDQVENAGIMLQTLIEDMPDVISLRVAYALQQFAIGETESAMYWLQDVDETNPSGELALLRGELYLRLYLYERARDEFALAMEQSPGSRRARLDYAHSLLRMEMVDEAGAVYEAMMEGRSLPESLSIQVSNALALIAHDQGELQKASSLWDDLISESDTARQLAQLNEMVVQPDEWSAADSNRLSELAMEPDSLPEIQYNLALSYEQDGRISDAIAAYEFLLIDNPRFLPGLLNLSELLVQERRFDESVPMALRARRVAPERNDIQTNLAAVLVEAELFEDAKPELDAVIERNPNDPQAVYNQAMLALWSEDTRSAGEYAARLAELVGENEQVWLIQGLIHSRNGNYREAEQAFRQARSINPDDAYVALNHGIVLHTLDRPERAQDALEEAVAIDSELAPGFRALGLLLAERGRYRESIQMLNLAIQNDPRQADLRGTIQQIQVWLAQEAQ